MFVSLSFFSFLFFSFLYFFSLILFLSYCFFLANSKTSFYHYIYLENRCKPVINPRKGFEVFRTRTETVEKNAMRKALVSRICIAIFNLSLSFPHMHIFS